MTKCPSCGKSLDVHEAVWNNVDTYRGSLVVKARCCNAAIRVSCLPTVFRVERTEIPADYMDAFGEEFDK
jgi:hypothetical protein